MSKYQVIQLHDSVDSKTLQFPKVPLEALIEDPNHRLVPFGIPVRAVVLTSMASADSPPEKANQRYYNTESHKLYTAIQSGAALVWDAGEYPQDGILYKVSQPGVMSDTLYVKSIGMGGVGLAKLAFDRTVTYSGPFAVGYTRYTDGTCTCSVDSGKVFAPWSAYDVPLESGIVVSTNEDLYIVGSSGASAILFQYTTSPMMQGDMRTRIARNAGGVMIQCQYGDILLAGITSSSGPTPGPIVKYPAPVIDPSRDNSVISNTDVTLIATLWDPAITSKQYSTNGNFWQTYMDGGVLVTSNGWRYFRGMDSVGDLTETASYQVTNIDKTAPAKPTATVSTTAPTNGNVTITVTFSSDSVQKKFSTDNGSTWSNYTAAIVATVNGTWEFKGIDAAGNESEVLTVTISNIDKEAPVQPTVSYTPTAETSGDVTITATYSSDSAQKLYSKNGGAWQNYTGAIIATTNGTYTFKGIDAAGNESAVTTCTIANINKDVPEAPTVSASPTTPTNGNVTLTAVYSSDTVTRQYKKSTDSTWSTYTAAVVVSSNGTYQFRGLNSVGTASAVTEYVVSNIDRDAPGKPTATYTPTAITNGDVTITVTFSSDSVQKLYSTNGGTSWTAYTTAVIATENGTWKFKGIDAAGNSSEVLDVVITNIDKTAPVIALSGYNNTTQTLSTSITASTETGLAIYWRKGDSGNWTQYTGPVSVTENGTWNFKATDAAGNTGINSVSFSNIIEDVTPPVITLTRSTTSPAQSVTLTATTDETATIEYNTTSASATVWTTYSGPITVTANGTYYFRATDLSGNVGTASVTISNIDRTAPIITLSGYNNTTPTPSTSITASTESGLTIQWRKGSSGNWTAYSDPVPVTENGTYNFRATDAAGNVGTASVSFTNIQEGDVTPPVITLTYNNTTPNLQSDTLTATTNETATIVYNTVSASATSWTEYTGPIEVYENGTYYFRATDLSGNVGTASVTYENFVEGHETDPGHVDPED